MQRGNGSCWWQVVIFFNQHTVPMFLYRVYGVAGQYVYVDICQMHLFMQSVYEYREAPGHSLFCFNPM